MNRLLLNGMFLMALICLQCGEANKTKRLQYDDELLHLLLDIQTARVVIDKSPPDERDSLSTIYWPQIMKLHGLSQDELDQVMDELREHPEAYDTLFLAMSQKLDSLREAMKKEEI